MNPAERYYSNRMNLPVSLNIPPSFLKETLKEHLKAPGKVGTQSATVRYVKLQCFETRIENIHYESHHTDLRLRLCDVCVTRGPSNYFGMIEISKINTSIKSHSYVGVRLVQPILALAESHGCEAAVRGTDHL